MDYIKKYWWAVLLVFALVLTVIITTVKKPDYDSYQLSGKYKVEVKTKERKIKTYTTVALIGKSATLVPTAKPYIEYTFEVSNGKTYQQKNNEKDYLGVPINEGDELYIYTSDASGWGDSCILSHREMTSQDFADNTSLFWHGVMIFFITISVIIGIGVIALLVWLIGNNYRI